MSNRLLAAIVDAGLVHPNGSPNKRAFAKALCEAAGDDAESVKLLSWERKVYDWTKKENPRGMSDESVELAARVLGIDADELRPSSVLEALEAEKHETRAQIDEIFRRLDRLEQPPEPPAAD